MTLYAGWDGVGSVDLPASVDLRLHKVRSFTPGGSLSGMVSVKLPFDLDANSGAHDVVHLHQGRDLMSVSAGWMANARQIPYLVQTHGMIAPDVRNKAKVMDAIASARCSPAPPASSR